jgi:hypothetical protein
MIQARRRGAAQYFSRKPIALERLEGRTLMAATPILIGAGAAKSVRYTDVSGTQVSVFLSGPGSAMVNIDGTNVGQSATAQGILVSGTGLTLSSIGVSGTTLSSSLDILTRGRSAVGCGPITVDGFLGALRATNVALTGNLTTSSYAHQIQLASASNGTINIGPSRFGGGAVIFQIGSATNESFVSALKVNLLKANDWTSNTGATQSIQAPQVQVLQVKGSFSPDLTLLGAPRGVLELTRFMAGSIDGGTWNIGGDSGAIQAGSATDWSTTFNGLVNNLTITHDLSGSIDAGTIKTLDIHGSMSNTDLQLTDPLTANGFDLNTLSVTGNIVDSTIRSIGSVGSISAASLQNSRVYAGIVNLPNGENLPMSANDIPISAQIRSLRLRKSATATFVNSDVAAATLGSLNLGTVRTANAGTPFGFAARQPIMSLQLTDEATGKSAAGHNVASTAAFNGLLAAKGIPQQDLVGEVF